MASINIIPKFRINPISATASSIWEHELKGSKILDSSETIIEFTDRHLKKNKEIYMKFYEKISCRFFLGTALGFVYEIQNPNRIKGLE